MSVCIEIGKYAITSDSKCWHISSKVKAKDKDGKAVEEWRPHLFYNSFESAMMGLYNLNLRASDAKSVLSLREAMHSASSKIIDACTPLRAENALRLKGE